VFSGRACPACCLKKASTSSWVSLASCGHGSEKARERFDKVRVRRAAGGGAAPLWSLARRVDSLIVSLVEGGSVSAMSRRCLGSVSEVSRKCLGGWRCLGATLSVSRSLKRFGSGGPSSE